MCHRINIYWIFPARPQPVSASSVRMWGVDGCVQACVYERMSVHLECERR